MPRHRLESVDHRLGDQADALVGAAEARGVELRVLADHQPGGNAHAASMTTLLQPRAAADLDVGQHHRVLDVR